MLVAPWTNRTVQCTCTLSILELLWESRPAIQNSRLYNARCEGGSFCRKADLLLRILVCAKQDGEGGAELLVPLHGWLVHCFRAGSTRFFPNFCQMKLASGEFWIVIPFVLAFLDNTFDKISFATGQRSAGIAVVSCCFMSRVFPIAEIHTSEAIWARLTFLVPWAIFTADCWIFLEYSRPCLGISNVLHLERSANPINLALLASPILRVLVGNWIHLSVVSTYTFAGWWIWLALMQPARKNVTQIKIPKGFGKKGCSCPYIIEIRRKF